MKRRSRRNPETIEFSRDQRARANEFAADVWHMVRGRRCRGQKFRREYPIPPYTVDFCCVALKLIIEIDGEPHQSDEGRRHDRRRDQFLAEQGYKIVRIPGYQVLPDAIGVQRMIAQSIDECIEQRDSLTPGPSPSS